MAMTLNYDSGTGDRPLQIKTSGAEQKFEQGAVRDTAANKPIMSLLSPHLFGTHLAFQGGEYVRSFLLTRNPEHLEHLLDTMLAKPDGYEKLCLWLKLGAERYAPYNWTKGMPISRCVDSIGRHMLAMHRGATDELHDAALMCNLMFVIHYMHEIREGRLDPKWNDLWAYDTLWNTVA
jgi:hypothetical protein